MLRMSLSLFRLHCTLVLLSASLFAAEVPKGESVLVTAHATK